MRDIDGAGHHPDKYQPGEDQSARVLAEALRGLLGALEDAQRWTRDWLERISSGSREDHFAEAIARSPRGESFGSPARPEPQRHPEPLAWKLKLTTSDGVLLEITTTETLEYIWRAGDRSTDGYVDILRMPRLHLWVKPLGWEEPQERLAQLDGSAALPDGMRRYR